MITPSSTFVSALRLGFGAATLLLCGCATARHPVGVTSPPPPLIGSAPISAYDDYALATFPPLATSTGNIAQNK